MRQYTPALASEQPIVDQVAAQRRVIRVERRQDRVDLTFGVPDARLERRHDVPQHDRQLPVRRRESGQPPALEEGPQHRLLGRIHDAQILRLRRRVPGGLLEQLGPQLVRTVHNGHQPGCFQPPHRLGRCRGGKPADPDELVEPRRPQRQGRHHSQPLRLGQQPHERTRPHACDGNVRPVATTYEDDLRLAHVMADQADALTMSRFHAADLTVTTKPDLTPVTDADHAAEDVLRSTLARARSRDAVLGEETGATGHGPRRWILDPIDGTKNFVRGVPVWATLIALMVGAEPVVGVVSAPALGRRWWAASGTGAWTGRSLSAAARCHVSDVGNLADASLSYSSLSGWAEQDRLDGFLDLTRRVWRTRAYGDFWSHMLVAEGAVDISCEPEVSLWDLAALSVIVTEAGGTFTDLAGRPGPDGGSVVCSNGRLHEQVLGLLRRPAPAGDLPDGDVTAAW